MVNYQKGKIYTIRSRNSDKVYVGSTCNELRKRIYEHKTDYKYWVVNSNCKYVSSFEVLKDGNCYIELFEKYPCNSKDELKRREGEVMRSIECVNKKKWIGMTREEMKEHIKEYNHEYYKEYYEENKEYYKEYYQNNKHIIKEYNKEYRKEYRKEYYQKNKEEYNKKQKEKITCGCGCVVSRRHKAVHMRSKKHKTWEEIQNIS